MRTAARRRLAGLAAALGLAAGVAACMTKTTEPSEKPPDNTPPPPTVAFVVVTGPTGFTAVGQTGSTTAMATYSDGSLQDVTSRATWGTDNGGVATASSTGVVTATGGGQTNISATWQGVKGTLAVFVRPISSTAAGYVMSHVNAYHGSSRWTTFPIPIFADSGYDVGAFSRAATFWQNALPGVVSFSIVGDRASASIRFDSDTTQFPTGACGQTTVNMVVGHQFRQATVVTNTSRGDCRSDETTAEALGFALGFFSNTPANTDIFSSPNPVLAVSAPTKDALLWIYAAPLGTTLPGSTAPAGGRAGLRGPTISFSSPR